MNILYENNAAGTLASPITNSALTITLNSGGAALFPSPVSPQVFYSTITDAATQSIKEIVKVTAVAGNIFTVVRGQDGTTPLSWNANDIIEQCAIRLEMQGWENAAEGNFSAQGVAVIPSTTLGIVATTLADNANPGSVGEALISSFSAVALTNNVTVSLGTMTLTPGDWDVYGDINFQGSGTLNAFGATIGPVSSAMNGISVSNPNYNSAIPYQRINLSTSTSISISVTAGFSGSINTSGDIRARRAR